MKRQIKIYALIITLFCAFSTFPSCVSAQQNEVNFQVFYDQLSPYGNWVEFSDYGYVWVPSLDSDFVPYSTNGYWVMTDYGWTWMSDYDWGWATFHYGRWDYNNSYGWFWVPDNEWGPSWVTWRRSEGYYGWAPMRPGVTINLSFGGYNDVPFDRWIFVRGRDIERHDIGMYHVDRRDNGGIFNKSVVINKTYYDDKRRSTYVSGPERDEVQRITGRTINPVAIRERDKPGQSLTHNQLQLFRPQVQRNVGGINPVPSKVADLKDLKRNPDRNDVKQPQTVRPPDRLPGAIRTDPPAKEIINDNTNVRNANPPIDSRSKVVPIQKQISEPPKRGDIKGQSTDPGNINPPDPRRIDNNLQTKPERITTPTRENRITGQPVQPKRIDLPKNNSTVKTPKVLPANPRKNKNIERKSKETTVDDKKSNDEKKNY